MAFVDWIIDQSAHIRSHLILTRSHHIGVFVQLLYWYFTISEAIDTQQWRLESSSSSSSSQLSTTAFLLRMFSWYFAHDKIKMKFLSLSSFMFLLRLFAKTPNSSLFCLAVCVFRLAMEIEFQYENTTCCYTFLIQFKVHVNGANSSESQHIVTTMSKISANIHSQKTTINRRQTIPKCARLMRENDDNKPTTMMNVMSSSLRRH